MCGKLSVVGHSPAFCIVKGAGRAPVTYQDLQAFLRVQVSKLDLNPHNYTSHSFHRGGDICHVQAGVNVNLIQALGDDWSSDAYQTYLGVELSDKVSAINKMYSCLSN